MSLVAKLAPHLPYVRRYGRALTGDAGVGDGCVRMTLEAIVAGRARLAAHLTPRVALYRAFHDVWRARDQAHAPGAGGGGAPEASADIRLRRMAPRSRQAFLLTAMEGFTPSDAAQILGADVIEVERLIAQAQSDIDRDLATQVLIIEDEPVIAADLEALVGDLGHSVTGVATTRREAIDAVARTAPGLVLADIQLADGSSGIDAVNDILASLDVPVIFITAFPERLLTGERPEPTFLITKPFQPETVKATIGQALFFHPGGARRERPAA